jgi:membrane protease YdiL (CAAX protease family)
MTADERQAWKRIGLFLLLVCLISALFNWLVIRAGTLKAGWGTFSMGAMWSPGIAAFLVSKLMAHPVGSFGWSWPKPRYVIAGWLLPLGYALLAYIPVWALGYGHFYDPEFVNKVAKDFAWQGWPVFLQIGGVTVLVATLGVIDGAGRALGEEIGWRGFLVPELMKVTSYTGASLLSGVPWVLFHVPVLLFGGYNNGTPAWYALTCFSVMVMALSFVFAWLRLRSGSLWPAVLLHASHNEYIQGLLTPITGDTGRTAWFIDEFSAPLAIASVLVAGWCWYHGDLVETGNAPIAASSVAGPSGSA